MKLLLTLMITGSALLIAGGDIIPVEVVTKYEKIEVKLNRCIKPDIEKCPGCVDIAELCPYNGEDLPLAKTEVCEGLNTPNQDQRRNQYRY